MKHVLDELADAFHSVRGFPLPRPIVTSLQLCDQFAQPITPRLWREFGSQLKCILPRLKQRHHGSWSLPNRCHTIVELSKIILRQHSEWVLPSPLQEATWREAQVFAGVRAVLVDALNVDPEEAVRTATLQGDLGAE